MTYEEALKMVRMQKERFPHSGMSVTGAWDKIEEALERQLHQRIVYYSERDTVHDMAECPECGYFFRRAESEWDSGYCPGCGQALDWSC